MITVNFEKSLDQLINNAIDNKITPGIALSIGDKNGILLEKFYGKKSINSQYNDINNKTMYDLASITKVLGTTTTLMKLIERGKCSIFDTLEYYYGITNEKRDINLKALLTHTSGLKATELLSEKVINREETVNYILNSQLNNDPNTYVEYSDLGFILLGNIIEKIADNNLSEVVKKLVLNKLDMKSTGYNIKISNNIAPTERIENSDEFYRGIVHDENSRFLGGISGHAGLFSNLEDMNKFASMLVNKGRYEGKRIIGENTFNLMTTNMTSKLNLSRGLGWMIFNLDDYSSGELITRGSFGHTGFTGTSIWIDIKKQIYVVSLSNRVHPTREDNRLVRFRKLMHNYIFANL